MFDDVHFVFTLQWGLAEGLLTQADEHTYTGERMLRDWGLAGVNPHFPQHIGGSISSKGNQ